MIPIRETDTGVVFNIRVVPRASRSEAAGFQGDALKLRITAPPVDGKANEACVALLAELLGVKKARVEIIAGQTSKTKTVAVEGMKGKEASTLIAAL